MNKAHLKNIEKCGHWIEEYQRMAERCVRIEETCLKAEMFSAATNPVLEAGFGLWGDNPLGLYDCVALEVRNRADFASPYDMCSNETIMNWRKVAF